jgi:hypothetical protein
MDSILVVNAGSSSVKFELFAREAHAQDQRPGRLVTGQVLVIESILDVRGTTGNVWIDVTMHGRGGSLALVKSENFDFIYSPTHRTDASVNAAHVVAAFELMDS